MPLTMPRILIVEDNPDLAYGLRTGLEIEGYEVQVAEDGETGLERARCVAPDLVMLDLMLPGMDGYRVLKTLREGGSDVPVLILTARGEEADKVSASGLARTTMSRSRAACSSCSRASARCCGGRGWPSSGRTPADEAIERFGDGGDQSGVAHGDEGGHSCCTEPERVRSSSRARPAARRGGVARRAAA